MGAKGTVDQGIVDGVLSGPYFQQDIPKTTGRETFGDSLAEEHLQTHGAVMGQVPEDCVATITRITAQSLLGSLSAICTKATSRGLSWAEVRLTIPTSLPTIFNRSMPETRFTTIDELGIPVGAKEALGFAHFILARGLLDGHSWSPSGWKAAVRAL